MAFFASKARQRTPSQLDTATNELKELIESEECLDTPAEAENIELKPVAELELYCKSAMGMDASVSLKETECSMTEKELSDKLLTLLKQKMMKQAGGKDDVSYTGEKDPWGNLLNYLKVISSGEGTKINFSVFPENIGYLTNLQQLELSGHSYATLSNNFTKLTKLQNLSLENSRLKSLGELAACPSLRKLSVKNNKLTSFSRSFQKLLHLNDVNMSYNQIKDISSDVGALLELIKLDVSFNRISKVNMDLKQMTQLEYLDISNNTLGSGIRNKNPLGVVSFLTGLKYLNVSFNKLYSLPSFDSLEYLEELHVQGNQLTEFPILKNNSLSTLNVSNNQIVAIPVIAFTDIPSLTSLNCSFNTIKFIPASLDKLQNLKKLILANNKISSLPDVLNQLSNLEELELSYNDIMVIQKGLFSGLKSLKKLLLNFNRVSRLPEDLFLSENLVELDLTQNLLQDLPKCESVNCPNLEIISLATNQINIIPDWFVKLSGLKHLLLHENPIQRLPYDFDDCQSIEIFSICNITIDMQQKVVTVLPPRGSTANPEKVEKPYNTLIVDEPALKAAVNPLFVLSRESTHRMLIFALAELSASRMYYNELQNYLEDFLLLLSNADEFIVTEATRALAALALNREARVKMFETPLLLQTLLVLANRFEKLSVATQGLNAVAHLCLNEQVSETILKQGIEAYIENEANHSSEGIREGCRKVLGNLGYIGHLNKRLSHLSEKRGIRILCMDGGGTKSVSTVTVLMEIEKRTGKKIVDLFDLICGTSVGGILACLLGIVCMDAEQVGILQKRVFKEIFTSGSSKSEGFAEKVALLSNLFSTGGRYHTPIFERHLREIFGEESLIDSSSREETAKVFVAAMHMDVNPPPPFLFRNYTYPPGVKSRYLGNCERKVWEGIRATSAAPSMFTECMYDGLRFSDGGMAVNNPSGLAYHEFKKIWGKDAKLDCLVSIGTGAPNSKNQTKSVKDYILSVIESATSVQRVDEIMKDFLSPDVYYRFNVIDDAFDVILDETRDERIEAMENASRAYCESVSDRIDELAKVLNSPAKE